MEAHTRKTVKEMIWSAKPQMRMALPASTRDLEGLSPESNEPPEPWMTNDWGRRAGVSVAISARGHRAGGTTYGDVKRDEQDRDARRPDGRESVVHVADDAAVGLCRAASGRLRSAGQECLPCTETRPGSRERERC